MPDLHHADVWEERSCIGLVNIYCDGICEPALKKVFPFYGCILQRATLIQPAPAMYQ